MGNDLVFALLKQDQLTKFVRFIRLAFANEFGVRFKDTEDLIHGFGVPRTTRSRV
jgi:hypothetical protein